MRVIHKAEDSVKKMELSVSDDRMKLFAKITPKEDCAQGTVEQLTQEIGQVAPVDLLEVDVLKDICKDLREGKGCDNRRVARGKQPEPGRDGKIVWMARRFSPAAAANDQRDFSDFFTLGLFENIEAGKEVARIYSPGGGAPGMDVLGKAIAPREGRSVSTRWDKTVELRSDPEQGHFTAVVAVVAGYIHEEGGSVSIRDTINISDNLDWRTGHIDFVGNVRVGGDVQKGFHIKARGDITIGGDVLGENILTSGGSISIDGYHLGHPTIPVTAKGDYTVTIAQGVVVNAGGNIVIEREARDCTLRAGLAVLAGNAAIVGGTVWCVRGLEADIIGNQAGLTTVIELRNELEVTRDYRVLAENIKKHEAALAALELHIGPYLKNRRRVPLLNSQFRAKISALLDRYDQVDRSLGGLRDQERKMRESKQVPQDARISASTTINAGVVLTSGEAKYELKEPLEGPLSFHRLDQHGEWLKDRFQRINRG
jgi:uncharacterized protein (DUF342 family)